MKKLVMLSLILALALICFTGCETAEPASDNNSPGNSNTSGDGSPDGDQTPPASANVEGDPVDLIGQIYENYDNIPDVKAALAQIEENAPRVGEITPRLDELYAALWAEGVTEEEKAEIQTEIDELEAELAELRKPESFRLPNAPAAPLTAEGSGFQGLNYFIGDGNEDIAFTGAAVSEPMIGGGYSLVLLRMEAGANVEDAKTRIKNGKVGDQALNWKWVCMGVDPGDFIVDNIGDLVVVIIAHNSKALHEAFLELAK